LGGLKKKNTHLQAYFGTKTIIVRNVFMILTF